MSNGVPLRCEGISKSYGGVRVLDDVSLQFPSSGIIALIGPNGAGKTTLLNVFTGYVRPDAGRTYIGGRDTTHLPSHRIARLGVARTFQDLQITHQVSAWDNVTLARPRQPGESVLSALFGLGQKAEADNRRIARSLLARVGLEQKILDFAGDLSYGQQKLLTLACVLATDVQMILLDEPVSGVHPEIAGQILALLRDIASDGRLIVFIEHDISFVRSLANEVVVMDEGRIIARGDPAEVLDRPEILDAYVT